MHGNAYIEKELEREKEREIDILYHLDIRSYGRINCIANIACTCISDMILLSLWCIFFSYGEGNGSIYMAEDMCSGEESRLLDCNIEPRISQPCDHSLDVGLQCGELMEREGGEGEERREKRGEREGER